jgi:hypothetical protein
MRSLIVAAPLFLVLFGGTAVAADSGSHVNTRPAPAEGGKDGSEVKDKHGASNGECPMMGGQSHAAPHGKSGMGGMDKDGMMHGDHAMRCMHGGPADAKPKDQHPAAPKDPQSHDR